jgi:hypothetical protein
MISSRACRGRVWGVNDDGSHYARAATRRVRKDVVRVHHPGW